MESQFKNKKFNQYNFHKHTFCVFKEMDLEGLNFAKANFVSKTNSAYIFTAEGVYRKSNHWGRVANCKWKLIANKVVSKNRVRVGYANWTDFRSENEHEANYIIVFDAANWSVDYVHFVDTNDQTLRRTAAETTKRLKEIRQILDNQNWIEYYEIVDKDAFLKNIVSQMIATNTAFRLLLNDFFK